MPAWLKGPMSKFIASAFFLFCASSLSAQAPLSLSRTIPLPGITGKFDHFAFDEAGNRLFTAATGSHAVVVIDLSKDNIAESLAGLGKPHGLAWVSTTERLFAADGQKGELDIFEGAPLKLVKTIKLSEDADDMVYDQHTGLLYVGHGGTDAANPSAVAVIDTKALTMLTDIPVAAHPEALEIDEKTDRIFVNISDTGTVVVIDGKTHSIANQWVLKNNKGNTPLAFDSEDGLLLVGCRTPAALIVLDSKTGKVLASAPSSEGADDLFFDEANRHAYLIAGAGAINSYAVAADGKLQALEETKTLSGAKTGLLLQSQHTLLVGIPSTSASSIRVYKTGRQ